MGKYSTQVKDHITSTLKDERVKFIDIGMENAIIDVLMDGKKLPAKWRNSSFNPTGNVDDAISLLDLVFPGDRWSIDCKVTGEIYEAYVKDVSYSVFAFNPARAVVLAMWNAWRLEHDTEKEGLDL